MASKARQEYQADLFFMTSGADVFKRKHRKDLVEVIDAGKPAILMTDVFSKLTKVLLIEDKKPQAILEGLRKLFDMMGGRPEVLYTDEEGSFLSNLVKKAWRTTRCDSSPLAVGRPSPSDRSGQSRT